MEEKPNPLSKIPKEVRLTLFATIVLGALFKIFAPPLLKFYTPPLRCIDDAETVCLDEYYRPPIECFMDKYESETENCIELKKLSDRNTRKTSFDFLGHAIEITKIKGSSKHMVDRGITAED